MNNSSFPHQLGQKVAADNKLLEFILLTSENMNVENSLHDYYNQYFTINVIKKEKRY